MRFFTLKRQQWQHPDPKVRIQAITHLSSKDSEFLARIADEDPDHDIRLLALQKIDDIQTLTRLAENAEDADVRAQSLEKADNLLLAALLQEKDETIQGALVERIVLEKNLVQVACHATSIAARSTALDLLQEETQLAKVAEHQCGRTIGETVINRIENKALLAHLSQNGGSKTVRRLADEKAQNLSKLPVDNAANEERDSKLASLLANAQRLVSSKNWDLARHRFEELTSLWNSQDPDHAHSDYAAFAIAANDFRKNYDHALIKREEERLHAARVRRLHHDCTEILEKIASLGFTDLDRNTCTELTTEFEGNVKQLPPDEHASWDTSLHAALQGYELNRQHATDRASRLVTLADQCDALLASLHEDTDCDLATQKLAGLHKELRGVKSKSDDAGRKVTQQADTIADKIAELRKLQSENRSQQLHTAQAARIALCEALKNLANQSITSADHDAFRAIEDAWSKLPVPTGNDQETTAREYRRLRVHFLIKQRDSQSLEEWRLWANRNLKEDLIAQVSALDGANDAALIFSTVRKAQTAWKKIGPVEQKHAQPQWRRFRAVCKSQFEKTIPWLEQKKQLRLEAKAIKLRCCEEVEALADSSNWQTTTQRIKEIQHLWNETSHLRPAEEQTLYQRFRQACNAFFERRRQHLEEDLTVRRQHLEEKNRLCEEVERICQQPELAHAARIKQCQKEWTHIGKATRKDEERVWKRFRAACDHYFSWLHEQRQEGIRAKELLCEKAEAITTNLAAGADANVLAEELKQLQHQWKDAASLPTTETKKLWQRFRTACDAVFEERSRQSEARRNVFEEHRQQKEALVHEAELLVAEKPDDPSVGEVLKDLQKRWKEIGSAGQPHEKKLWERLRSACDTYFSGRKSHHKTEIAEQLENQRRKEALCFQLEKLAGITARRTPGHAGANTALSLAEELKLALEANFAMADRNQEEAKRDEVQRIKKEWKVIEPAPARVEPILTRRFERAIDTLARRQEKKTSHGTKESHKN